MTYHRLNTKLYKVFPRDYGVVATYGRFYLKHEFHTDPSGTTTPWSNNHSYDCSFVSVDGAAYVKYDYAWHRLNPALSEELDAEIQKAFDAQRAERTKHLTQERVQRDQATAKKRGISLEDLRAERKAERTAVVDQHKMEERVECTNRLMKAAPMIRILHDDLDDLLKKIERGEQVRIGHVDTGLRRLQAAQTVVARWRKSYQKKG